MKISRCTLGVAAFVLGVIGASADLHAQGVTTGAVAGTVTDETGKPVEGAIVKVVNRNSGFSASGSSRAATCAAASRNRVALRAGTRNAASSRRLAAVSAVDGVRCLASSACATKTWSMTPRKNCDR